MLTEITYVVMLIAVLKFRIESCLSSVELTLKTLLRELSLLTM